MRGEQLLTPEHEEVEPRDYAGIFGGRPFLNKLQ